MFSSTFGFTLHLRAAFSSAEGKISPPPLLIVTAVVKRAFDNLDWDCFPDNGGSVLRGSTFRWPKPQKMKAVTIGEKIAKFLGGHMNSVLRDLPDNITWTFSESSDQITAEISIFIQKEKMGKTEAKERLSNVTKKLFDEIARVGYPLGLRLSVEPAKNG